MLNGRRRHSLNLQNWGKRVVKVELDKKVKKIPMLEIVSSAY